MVVSTQSQQDTHADADVGVLLEDNKVSWKFVPAQDRRPARYLYYQSGIQKSENDDREYRVIRLENGMEAVLVNDKETDKAAASLNVAVGMEESSPSDSTLTLHSSTRPQPTTMWPREVIALFKGLPACADELEWLMPWNALLNTCFHLKEGFAVAPVVELEQECVDQVEFLRRSYVIKQFLEANGKRESCDSFFVEVKRPTYLGSRLYRREVDSLMRRRFYEIENISSTLHGIAAFGTRVAFYHVDKASGRISPAPVEDDVNIVKDTCPESRWETDILTEDGFNAFMKRVNEAKELGKQELQRRAMGS